MELRVNLNTIIFYVSNVERLKTFYIDTFNLKIVEEYGSLWVLLAAGNTNIGFHKIGEQYLEKHTTDVSYLNNTKIVFDINADINEIRAQLITKNVPMRELKTFDDYDYWLCDGEDPEGNVFQLKQRKK